MIDHLITVKDILRELENKVETLKNKVSEIEEQEQLNQDILQNDSVIASFNTMLTFDFTLGMLTGCTLTYFLTNNI